MKQFERTPLSADELATHGDTQDWGESLSNITHAVGHLEEAVPNGQVERTEVHLIKLEHNVKQLRKYLEIRGVADGVHNDA